MSVYHKIGVGNFLVLKNCPHIRRLGPLISEDDAALPQFERILNAKSMSQLIEGEVNMKPLLDAF